MIGCEAIFPRNRAPFAVPFIAWLLIIISVLALIILLISESLEIDIIIDFEKYISIGVAVLLIIAAILILCTPAALMKGSGGPTLFLSGEWIAAVVFVFISAIACAAPAVLDFFGIEL